MEKDLGTANGPIRHLEFLRNFNKSFRTFKTLTNNLPRNMFLETGSVLRKKGGGRPTKRTVENIEEVEQKIAETPNKSIRRLVQKTNLAFGTAYP
jgi:hypothetical protein